MNNSTKELVNAFNLNNYAIDNVNTNFTVKGKKIVGLFASGTNVEEYLRGVGEKIIKLHYYTREAASEYYNLQRFPFVLGANSSKKKSSIYKGVMEVELAGSTDKEVIRNLKLHFINEFERTVGLKVIASLKKEGITEEEAREWAEGTIQVGAIGKPSPYLYCVAFNDEYFRREGYDSETFESFKEAYIQEFNSRLEKCSLKSSDFYERRSGMLCIKNIGDKVVRNVTEYMKGRVALDFRTPGNVESKVENCKNVLSELIYGLTGKCVDGYDYDVFTNAKKMKNGNSFALIPFIEVSGQLQSLSKEDVDTVNSKFGTVMSDIGGKTANPQFAIANCKEPVYAISNKRITQLLPIIMQSPIAYNEELGRFEFAVDLEKFKDRQRSFSPDSGSDGEGQDSPSSSLKRVGFPRQGMHSPLLLRSVEAKENVLWSFILHLPLEKNEELRAKIHSFLSSNEGTEKLYSALSSFCDRDGLYSEFHLSREQRGKMESRWQSLHQFEESLSASSEGLEGLTLGEPGCRGSVASKGSKTSEGSIGYFSASSSSLSDEAAVSDNSEFSDSSEFSDDDTLSRNSLRSSTNSSVSSGASAGTIVADDKRGGTLRAGALCSKGGSTSRVDVSRYNEEHGPTVLHNADKGIAKKFGLESAFEPDKYDQSRKNWERYGRDRAIKRAGELKPNRSNQEPSTGMNSTTLTALRERLYRFRSPC